MSSSPPAFDLHHTPDTLIEFAVDLLSQQVWCWGCDILRPEGNWLLDFGFTRIEPPADLEGCASVYRLELPEQRCVVLRGFGVFLGDPRHGGVFLPRYEFQPRYTPNSTLASPPWTEADLPELLVPNDSQRPHVVSLTLDLLDWIRAYEADIAERLGIEHRRSTLSNWDNGKRTIIPAEDTARAWRFLGMSIAEDARVLFH